MKDTEAWVVTDDDGEFRDASISGEYAERLHSSLSAMMPDDAWHMRPVVIVSADRYRSLVALEERIKRWVREEQEKEAVGT